MLSHRKTKRPHIGVKTPNVGNSRVAFLWGAVFEQLARLGGEKSLPTTCAKSFWNFASSCGCDGSLALAGSNLASIWLRPLGKKSSDKFLLKPTGEKKQLFLSKWKMVFLLRVLILVPAKRVPWAKPKGWLKLGSLLGDKPRLKPQLLTAPVGFSWGPGSSWLSLRPETLEGFTTK